MEVPGGRASVDNQGKEETCTLHSVAKAHVNGFDTGKFHPTKLDFEQSDVTASLHTQKEETCDARKWPTDFNGVTFPVIAQDKDKTLWNTLMDVEKIEQDVFVKERNEDRNEHCIVAFHPTPHTMYVKTYNDARQEIKCINSWGNQDPEPTIRLSDVNGFYRIVCHAVLQKDRAQLKKIQNQWSKKDHLPSISAVKTASNLASGGYLTSLDYLMLANVDFDSAKIEVSNWEKLASIIKQKVCLSGVVGDWSPVFKCLQCKELEIKNREISDKMLTTIEVDKVNLVDIRGEISFLLKILTCKDLDIGSTDLDEEDSRVLKEALDNRVENLGLDSETTLKFSVLEGYNGKGKCKQIIFRGDTRGEYESDSRSWAQKVGWYCQNDTDGNIRCSFISPNDLDEVKKIEEMLNDHHYQHPHQDQVEIIANFAFLGHLTPRSVIQLRLRFVDINKIDPDHVAKLAKISKGVVALESTKGNLDAVISNVNCEELDLRDISLSNDDTKKLLDALENRIEKLILSTNVHFHLPILTQYKGSGKCEVMEFWIGAEEKYKTEAESWAQKVGWRTQKVSGHLGPKLRIFKPFHIIK